MVVMLDYHEALATITQYACRMQPDLSALIFRVCCSGLSGDKSVTINLAPAPSFDAAAQQAIASASPDNHTAVNVYFTLVLTGYDAVVRSSKFSHFPDLIDMRSV